MDTDKFIFWITVAMVASVVIGVTIDVWRQRRERKRLDRMSQEGPWHL